jgi:hypothetical protein
MKSASRYPQLDGTLILPGSGGNLARVISNALSSQTGHFLFMSKQLKKLLRQFTNAGGVSSFSPTSAGAASNRRALMSAKSRPLPFSEVNYVAHVRLSFCETKFNRSAVA